MGGMLESLLELGPSAIDLELRSLAPEGGGSLGLMESFLKMIRWISCISHLMHPIDEYNVFLN